MNDHEFDLRLKQRASIEADPVPAGLGDRLRTAVEELPEEQRGAKRARFSALRPALVAAVLIAALLVPVLAAGAGTGFNFLTFFNGDRTTTLGDPEAGETRERSLVYGIRGDQITYFPVENLSDELREAAKENGDETAIVNQSTWQQAEAFLGMELANSSVLKSGVQTGFGWAQSDSEMPKPCKYLFHLYGEDPSSIYIYTYYYGLASGVRITMTIEIMTDSFDESIRDEIWFMTLGDLNDTWTKEEYLTPTGLETVIIGDMGDVADQCRYNGVFVLNGMIYTLQAAGPDAEQVVTVLKEVLDGFQ